jgi:iron complex outermembrane receptor protein
MPTIATMPLKLLGCLLLFSSLTQAQQHTQLAASSLADLSLEELGNLRVTTAALRPERLDEVPASIFVITGDDIRHSGATSLAEALRLAPNLEVARVSASTYAISARGFLNVITNKLLVLVDGRKLYTTVLSGVLWDAQDVMLEDVERIEVISGPGAALYGANAFVGVINVITRNARSTKGTVVVAGAGRLESNVMLRHGADLGSGAFRIYAMHIDRDGLRPVASGLPDDMKKDQVGFRTDFGNEASGAITVQGDAYRATIEGNGARAVKLEGGNVLARWGRALGGGSRVKIQVYYDHTNRDDPGGFIDRVDTLDLEAQHDLPNMGAHRISYGVGYRVSESDVTPTSIIRFIPSERRLQWGTFFAQDEVMLGADVTLTVGGKLQSTPYVRPEFMPDVRLDWKATPNQFTWVAASRVARTPGRIDRDFNFPGNPPFFIRGGPDFQSETGNVYEIGYRAQPRPWVNFSVAAFYARLDDLRGGRLAPGGGAFISNEAKGTSSGIEAWAIVEPMPRWRVSLGLLELRQDLHPKTGSSDLGAPAALGNDPRHTLKVRSTYRLTDDIDLDIGWRYVSALSYLSTVPGYQEADARIAWRLNDRIELAISGTNLLHRGHVEFDEHGLPAVIPRAVYFQVGARF